MTCGYCGFEGDRDVIGAINIALRGGFLILMKCVREGIIGGVARKLQGGLLIAFSFVYSLLIFMRRVGFVRPY